MNLAFWKNDIITGLVVAATFLFFVFTKEVPALGSFVQGFILMLIFFGFVPICYHFLVQRKTRTELGLFVGPLQAGITMALVVAAALFLFTVLIISFFDGFWTQYNLPLTVRESFGWFLLYELILVPVTLVFFEIFFRGFIQRAWLKERLGLWAAIAQAALFSLFLLATNNVSWVTAPLILGALGSGFLVHRYGSLLYGFLATWAYILLLDVYFLVMV